MIPLRYAPVLFAFILSGTMSLLVSGISSLRAVGTQRLLEVWPVSWLMAWAMAFPIVLVIAPLTQRLVARLVSAA